jgi:DNA-binding NarL/FixJ family response regulator
MTRTTESRGFTAERPEPDHGAEPADALTRREQQVLTMVLQGLTSTGVANQLGVSRRTVEVHLCGIYDKLGARTRVQAIGEAARRGLFPSA